MSLEARRLRVLLVLVGEERVGLALVARVCEVQRVRALRELVVALRVERLAVRRLRAGVVAEALEDAAERVETG